MKYILLPILASVLFLSGCSSSTGVGSFTMASTHNVRGIDYNAKTNTVTYVKGMTCTRSYVGFTVPGPDNPISIAMDKAIRSGQSKGVDGDLLVNVLVQNEKFSVPFYSSDCYIVKGDLIRIDK